VFAQRSKCPRIETCALSHKFWVTVLFTNIWGGQGAKWGSRQLFLVFGIGVSKRIRGAEWGTFDSWCQLKALFILREVKNLCSSNAGLRVNGIKYNLMTEYSDCSPSWMSAVDLFFSVEGFSVSRVVMTSWHIAHSPRVGPLALRQVRNAAVDKKKKSQN